MKIIKSRALINDMELHPDRKIDVTHYHPDYYKFNIDSIEFSLYEEQVLRLYQLIRPMMKEISERFGYIEEQG